MSWSFIVDIIILAYLGFSVWRGYKSGLLAASANLVGLAASLVAAYLTYYPLSQWIGTIWSLPASLLNIFSFLLIAFVVDTLITGAVLLGTRKAGPRLSWAIRPFWLAAVPGLINGLVTVGYMVTIISALPIDHPLKTSVTQAILARPLIYAINSFDSPADKLITPALNDLSQLFTIEPGSKDMVKLNFSSDQATIDEVDEAYMLRLLNQERTSRGLTALTMDPQLRQLARQHSLDMFKRGYFSHYTPEGLDPFNRMERAGISYLAAGENLALAPTVQMAHTGLMNSPGHKANMLDTKFHKVGIGAYKDSRYGIIFTQEFTN